MKPTNANPDLEANFQNIPLLDLENLEIDPVTFSQKLREICHYVGFFYLRSPSVPSELIEDMLKVTAQFFDLPQAEKDQISIAKSPHFRGYGRLNQEMTLGRPDFKETYDLGLEQPAKDPVPEKPYLKLQGPNQWPDKLGPEWKKKVLDYTQMMQKLGEKLMSAMALALGQSPLFFSEEFKAESEDSFAMLRLLRYPPRAKSKEVERRTVAKMQVNADLNGALTKDYPSDVSPTYGVGPHVDSGCLVILLQDEVGGLQVQNRKGDWIDAPPIPGTLVVNIGKMLQLWSNHYFLATPHRVLNSSSKIRHSVPFFFEPGLSTVVRPLTLPSHLSGSTKTQVNEAIVYGQYMLSVFERSFPSAAPQ